MNPTTRHPAAHPAHPAHPAHRGHADHAGHHARRDPHATHDHGDHRDHPAHHGHPHRQGPAPAAAGPAGGANAGLTRMAFFATLHCLMGCAVGEVLGLVIGTALGWGNVATIALAVGLAFAFGYAFTIVPLVRGGMPWREAARLALAADTASIAVMEIVDNGVMWAVPGAMDAGLDTPLFWGAMAFSLGVALLAAWPLNRWLLARGRGHALVHAGQGHAAHPGGHP